MMTVPRRSFVTRKLSDDATLSGLTTLGYGTQSLRDKKLSLSSSPVPFKRTQGIRQKVLFGPGAVGIMECIRGGAGAAHPL